MGTGASRMSDPLAADSGSGAGSTGSPVRSKRASWAAVVPPMSKHSPVDERYPSRRQAT